MREAQAANKEPQHYDGRCRGLDAAARARLEAEGRGAALRFAHEAAGETAWKDVVRGRVAFRNEVLDDFVLLRADGLPTYNFACVVDDHEMAITHVIRGDDHISNTPRQIALYDALGWEPPVFAHVSMILGSDGSRLSKRHGATAVAAYRDLGYVPAGMVNFLALLGWAYDDKAELFTLAELERVFRLERVSRNPAVFNLEKLEWLNGQHLKRLSDDERTELITGFLAARGHDLSRHPAAWWTALVRTLGDRLQDPGRRGDRRSLRAARRAGDGARGLGRVAGEAGGGPEARTVGGGPRGRPRVQPREPRTRDAGPSGRAGRQARRAHGRRARGPDGTQDRPRPVRGDGVAGAGASGGEVAGRGRALERGVGPGPRLSAQGPGRLVRGGGLGLPSLPHRIDCPVV